MGAKIQWPAICAFLDWFQLSFRPGILILLVTGKLGISADAIMSDDTVAHRGGKLILLAIIARQSPYCSDCSSFSSALSR